MGPHFFVDEAANAVTVTGHRYRSMIVIILGPTMENMPEIWIQQYGTSAHTTNAATGLLKTIFDYCIISRNTDINFYRSPDLTTLYFSFWGYLKDKMYVKNHKLNCVYTYNKSCTIEYCIFIKSNKCMVLWN